MPEELFGGAVADPRVRRSWSLLPVSIAAHVVVAVALLVIPLVAAVPPPDPVPVHPVAFIAARAVPPAPIERPRTAPTPAPSPVPLTAPPAIRPERALPTPAPVTALPVEGGLPEGGSIGAGTTIGPPAAVPPPAPLPPPAPRTVRIGGGVDAPTRLVDVRPVYPAIARAAHVEGTVMLEAVLGLDGRVEDVHVVKSVALLDQAAIDAVRQWRYTPTRLDGQPVRVLMTITVRFSLH